MRKYLIVPGLGNSGEDHWQSYFEKTGDNFIRVNQANWDSPVCSDWMATIDNSISKLNTTDVILIGHSLGCAAIVHWATNYKKLVHGAFLVAPSDPEAPQYVFPAEGFNPLPLQRINFKTVVVTSTDDPWVSFERAILFAESWGSKLVNIGNAGHINVSSGFGKWDAGLELLNLFDEI